MTLALLQTEVSVLLALDLTLLSLYGLFMWLLSDDLKALYAKKKALRATAKMSAEVPRYDDGPG